MIRQQNQNISLLIPYYNFPTGLGKIFLGLESIDFWGQGTNPSVIISNDGSSSDEHLLYLTSRKIEYPLTMRQGPKQGAVLNWNSLVDLADEYFILLHQDEFLVESVEKKKHHQFNNAYVYVADLHVKRSGWRYILPARLRCYLINNFPSLILHVNFIGPTASLIIPRCEERFNQDLKWLVDVEFYYRLTKKYTFKPHSIFSVVSDSDIQNSITNSMSRDQILNIRDLELKKIGVRRQLFLGFFFKALWFLYRYFRRIPDYEDF